jgi:predicted ATPase
MSEPLPPMFQSITLQGFLSYGPEAAALPLTALNVLIGPNGSGKSNLVEALAVLRAVPRDLPLPIRQGGGVKDWLWREGKAAASQARLEILLPEEWVAKPGRGSAALRYRLAFGAQGGLVHRPRRAAS